MTATNEVLEHYRRLLGADDDGLWDAVSWTVLVGPGDDVDIAAGLGSDAVIGDEENLTSLFDRATAELDDSSAPAMGVAWLVREPGWAGLFEINGLIGASKPSLAALSWAASHVASAAWNEATGVVTAAYARGGVGELIEVEDRSKRALKDAPTLARVIAQLEPELKVQDDDWPPFALSVVETLSQARLSDEILRLAWPTVRFVTHESSGTRTSQFESQDPVLANALVRAAPETVLRAQTLVVEAVLTATDLSDSPTATATARLLAAGDPPGATPELIRLVQELDQAAPTPRSGEPDYSDPAWQRRKAGAMLQDFAVPQPPGSPDYLGGWLQAGWALDTRWRIIRSDVLRLLSGRGDT